MTFKKYDKRVLKRMKAKTRNIGRRSIYDIIKDKELDFNDKVDYIRHHYTYYEGNYEFFHDKRGASNEEKEHLNQLIKLIILRKADPSELKKVNRQIQKWRKQKDGKILKEKKINESLKLNYQDIINWKEIVLKKSGHFNSLPTIEEFLLSRDNTYTAEQLLNTTYRQVKKAANVWKQMKYKQAMHQKVKKDINEKGLIEFNLKLLAKNDNLEKTDDKAI